MSRIFERDLIRHAALELKNRLPLFMRKRMLQETKARVANTFHRFTQTFGRALRSRRGIIQFMRQTRGKFSQGH